MASAAVSNGNVSSAAATPAFSSDVAADLADTMNDTIRSKYTKDRKLGEGTYAIVYAAHEKTSGAAVAIKKIKLAAGAENGMTMDSIREIKFLQELRHVNVIRLLDVFASKSQNINLVLEFLPGGDLEMIIKDMSIVYSVSDIKSWMAMTLRGIWWCHKNFVLHRDIKPNNLLLSGNGVLKVSDFGLARSFSDPYRAMTSQVITRWYRPPELLFGAKFYSSAVDIFSVGLVFAELALRIPLLSGDSDLAQLNLIGQALGTPTEVNWPGVTKLPQYVTVPDQPRPESGIEFYSGTFRSLPPSGQRLLYNMLRLDPRKRISAKAALESAYFREEPAPTKPENLPKKGGVDAAAKMGEDLKRRAGFDESLDGGDLMNRAGHISRKLEF